MGTRRAPDLVSVIIPARNAAVTIDQQLAALSRQSYDGPWDVVVVDNCSSDSTAAVVRRWSDRLPGLRVVGASSRPDPSYARNVGAASSSGDFLAYCDADDVVTPGWLSALVAASSFGDMVGGPLDLGVLNDSDVHAWTGWQCPADRLAPAQHFLFTAYGGNCGIWRSALEKVDGWNVEYDTFNDRELSWRVQLAGFRLTFAPGAIVHSRLRSNLRTLWTKNYRDGKGTVQLFHDYAPAGAPRSNTRDALRSWAVLVRRLPELGSSRARRGGYVRVAAQYAGRLAGSLRYRTIYL